MRKNIVFLVIWLATISVQAQEKQNALLIILDDMNDYIGVMGGHPQAITPNIDRLANEGVFFSNAHSSAPICAPSRASFLSGLYPSTTGNFGFAHIEINTVLMNSKFIMEYAAENGFETYSTGKVFHRSVDDKSQIIGKKQDQGPTAWDGSNAIAHPSVPTPFREVGLLNGSFAPLSDVPQGGWRNNYDASTPFRYVSENDRDKMCDEISADFICQWIDNHEVMRLNGEDKPFFMAYGGMKPHTPHIAPKRFFDMYPLDKVFIPEILKSDLNDTYYENFSNSGFKDYDALLSTYPSEEEGLKRYVQSKLACITFADSLVGVIVDKIQNSSFADNTVIILCGDNGFHMGEKSRLAKNTLWEESTRVPFIISAPGYEASKGKEVLHPIGLIDIYPTFTELCGMTGETKKNEKGAELDGHSLRTFLENPETQSWEGPNVALEAVLNPSSTSIALQNYAVRSTNYRYILYPSGKEELYYHGNDNNEWRNLIFDPGYDSIALDLRNELKALVPDVGTENENTIPNLFFDDFESYSEGDDLLSEGYKQKPDEISTITVAVEDSNKYAKTVSVNGSIVSMRKSVKNLTPGKLYFFEAKTRTETSVSAGSWDAEIPNTLTNHVCTDWLTFSMPLIPKADSWSGGTSMSLWINSFQNKPLDVDSFRFYAAKIQIISPKSLNFRQLISDNIYQFEATIVPENEPYSWSAVNGTGSASIDQTGKLTAISEGTARLILTMDNYPLESSSIEVFIWDGLVNPVLSIEEISEPAIVGIPLQLSSTLNPDYDSDILWSVDDESIAIINQTTGFLLPKSVGTITVEAKLYNNDEIYDTKQITIDQATAIKNKRTSYFKVYPNPSEGIFYIVGNKNTEKYKVYDTAGRLVHSSLGKTVNMMDFPKGLYYLQIDGNKVEKIVLK
ncbi:MAG: sulfatase-like hydrolase/transferase [Bacteroidales bacterium]|nr:sulfatase-like hydrolase/transferase [Bacteroidales bacterium]